MQRKRWVGSGYAAFLAIQRELWLLMDPSAVFFGEANMLHAFTPDPICEALVEQHTRLLSLRQEFRVSLACIVLHW